ncbi:hypothetical protein PIB30_083372 [Stylosanthes scabra]|uniref:Zinc knuckle CX2CX4HX4C domain-containing protein n=1 Tax=Stylosanthes scabra TaxID=79078 RepID=A0ABU6RT10_9FABA|nr:hypothetical protein [Stylosanthes scabra]
MNEPESHPIEGQTIIINSENEAGFQEDHLKIVGKILTDKEINFRTTKAALLGIWGHPEGVAINEVGRNTVLISLRNKLKGCWIATANRPKAWIDFKFERINNSYCLNFGIIGHGKKDCQKPMAKAAWDPQLPRYRPGLGVPRAPRIIVTEARSTEEEQFQKWEAQKTADTKQEDSLGGDKIRIEFESQGSGTHMENSLSSTQDRWRKLEKKYLQKLNQQFAHDKITNQIQADAIAPQKENRATQSTNSDSINQFNTGPMCMNEDRQDEQLPQQHSLTIMNEKEPESKHIHTIQDILQQKYGNTSNITPTSQDYITCCQYDASNINTTQQGEHKEEIKGNNKRKPEFKSSDQVAMQQTHEGAIYYVQLPEDDATMEREDQLKTRKDETEVWENELASSMHRSLNLKRGREITDKFTIEDFNQNQEQSLEIKKRKTNFMITMAEEAGLIKPHPQP